MQRKCNLTGISQPILNVLMHCNLLYPWHFVVQLYNIWYLVVSQSSFYMLIGMFQIRCCVLKNWKCAQQFGALLSICFCEQNATVTCAFVAGYWYLFSCFFLHLLNSKHFKMLSVSGNLSMNCSFLQIYDGFRFFQIQYH